MEEVRNGPDPEEAHRALMFYQYEPLCEIHRSLLRNPPPQGPRPMSVAFGLSYCGTIADSQLVSEAAPTFGQGPWLETILGRLKVPVEERFEGHTILGGPPAEDGHFVTTPWVLESIRRSFCGDGHCLGQNFPPDTQTPNSMIYLGIRAEMEARWSFE